MKNAFLSVLCAVGLVVCATGGDASDPTIPAEAMADRLKAVVAGSQRLSALVVGESDDGVAMVGDRFLRRGGILTETIGGVKVEVAVSGVTSRGVELAAPGAGDGSQGAFIPGSFAPLPPPATIPPEFLRYLECEKVPLNILMRLLSDQAGVNISASEATSSREVTIFLRNITAEAAVEEICRAAGLWFRREKGSDVIRIMTMEEYSDSLNTFREEVTEMFTLLYPNVVEVASVIYGLYPDRTLLSLGEEEFDEDEEYDLSRRFRRFRVMEDNGGSQFMSMEAPRTSTSGGRSGSGNFSFSRGGAASRMTQWDQFNMRGRRGRQYDDYGVNYGDAALMGMAMDSGDTNFIDRVRARATGIAANIFVSMSRKNNMLIVRTSDVRVMDEIRAIVKRLDVPTPMVLMEVKVLELSIDDDYESSFSYAFNRDTHTVGNSGRVGAGILPGGQDAFSPTFAFSVVNSTIDAQMKLLQKDGKVKTLATPTLLVANNEVARIFSGKEYPLVTGWTAGSASQNDGQTLVVPTVPQIDKEDVGTMLLITPNINADKTVTLRLVQENSEISANTAPIPVYDASGNSVDKAIQYVESRSLAGTFVASDGMSIMAGGLVKETDGVTYWRTPVLGSIPLIGWLFRGTEKVKNRSELIVVIKPHVISTPMEGGRISKELLKALSAHPAVDGRDTMGVHKPDMPHDVADDLRSIVQ